jgi:hypothetical protein
LRRKSRQLLKRLWPRRNFRKNRLCQFLSSPVVLRWESGLKVGKCLSSCSLLKTGVPHGPLKMALQLSLQRPLNGCSNHWMVLSWAVPLQTLRQSGKVYGK